MRPIVIGLIPLHDLSFYLQLVLDFWRHVWCHIAIIMAALRSRCGHCILSCFSISSSFLFSSRNLSGHRLDVYHTSTHGVALVRRRTQRIAKKSPSAHHRANLSGYFFFFPFATKTYIDNRQKYVKQQYLFYMPSKYGELRPTNDWDTLSSLGHPSKFKRVSSLGFVTAATSLTAGQPNFARCLAISWAGTLYIHFRGLGGHHVGHRPTF